MFVFFFFKQKTAYEMRISDWSSDVCSSDLKTTTVVPDGGSQDYSDEEIDGSVASGEGSTVTFNNGANITGSVSSGANSTSTFSGSTSIGGDVAGQIGRASCRERVCQYV